MFANAENTQSESEPRYQPAHYQKERQRVKGKNTASLIPASGKADYCAFPSFNSVETDVK